MKSAGSRWSFVGLAVLVVIAGGCACRIGRPEMVERPTQTIVQQPPPVVPPPIPPPVDPPPVVIPSDPPADEPPPPVVPDPVVPPPVRPPLTDEEVRVFQMIHFDFDKYDIRPDARPILENIAAYLGENPGVNISIEGHTDERGTEEYNMALGERRALSARAYLVNLGIDGSRLHTISFGEEVPLDPRSNEVAWALNRRCEFRIVEDRP